MRVLARLAFLRVRTRLALILAFAQPAVVQIAQGEARKPIVRFLVNAVRCGVFRVGPVAGQAVGQRSAQDHHRRRKWRLPQQQQIRDESPSLGAVQSRESQGVLEVERQLHVPHQSPSSASEQGNLFGFVSR